MTSKLRENNKSFEKINRLLFSLLLRNNELIFRPDVADLHIIEYIFPKNIKLNNFVEINDIFVLREEVDFLKKIT